MWAAETLFCERRPCEKPCQEPLLPHNAERVSRCAAEEPAAEQPPAALAFVSCSAVVGPCCSKACVRLYAKK